MKSYKNSESISRDRKIAMEWTIKDGAWILDLYVMVEDKCSKFHNELFQNEDEIPYDEEVFFGQVLTMAWQRIVNSRIQYPVESKFGEVVENEYFFLYLELEPNKFIEISDPQIRKLPKVKSLDNKRVSQIIDEILKPARTLIKGFRNEKLESDLLMHKLFNVVDEQRIIKINKKTTKVTTLKKKSKLKVGRTAKFDNESELIAAVKNISNYKKLSQTQLSIKLGFKGESGLRTTLGRLNISFNELITH